MGLLSFPLLSSPLPALPRQCKEVSGDSHDRLAILPRELTEPRQSPFINGAGRTADTFRHLADGRRGWLRGRGGGNLSAVVLSWRRGRKKNLPASPKTQKCPLPSYFILTAAAVFPARPKLTPSLSLSLPRLSFTLIVLPSLSLSPSHSRVVSSPPSSSIPVGLSRAQNGERIRR